MNKIITGLFIGVILLGIAGCTSSKPDRPDFTERDNFQIDEETKSQILSFFEETSDLDEINSYCEENMMHCGYYCMEINPDYEICNQIKGPQMRMEGNETRIGNKNR